jgi:peptidoglycan/xylan/chitin deacetylase (PgdA/CDA1 family)
LRVDTRLRKLARIGAWVAGIGVVVIVAVTALLWHPSVVVGALSRRDPDVLYFAQTNSKTVALSIDDAPSAHTDLILATLREHGVKATFFVIGANAAKDPAALARIVAAGHELGNHLYTDRASARLSSAEFLRELTATDSIIRQYQTPRWFRPGSGWYTSSMLDAAKQMGYRCALGSVYPLDPHVPWPWYVKQVIRRAVRAGAVIILHDGETRGVRTTKVLSDVLPALRAAGYSVVSIGELVPR